MEWHGGAANAVDLRWFEILWGGLSSPSGTGRLEVPDSIFGFKIVERNSDHQCTKRSPLALFSMNALASPA